MGIHRDAGTWNNNAVVIIYLVLSTHSREKYCICLLHSSGKFRMSVPTTLCPGKRGILVQISLKKCTCLHILPMGVTFPCNFRTG